MTQTPAVHESAFLEMTGEDRRILKKELSPEQYQNGFGHPAHKKMVALVKSKANVAVQDMVSGKPIPKGLDVTDRVSFYLGLVTGFRAVLDLEHVLLEDAQRAAGEDEVVEEQTEPDPFAPSQGA